MLERTARRVTRPVPAAAWIGILAAVLLLLPGAQALSQDAAAAPVYDIELIVFRASSAQGGAENWSVEGGADDSDAGAETSSGSSQQARFVAALPASQFQLSSLESRLRSSGAYVPLAHVEWSQTASAWGTRAGFPVGQLGIDVPGLTGTVFLERGQYLHLGMTLSYADPAPPAGIGAAPGTPLTMSQTRRVRFYERNYYDHPAFGVIALVTPAHGNRPPGR